MIAVSRHIFYFDISITKLHIFLLLFILKSYRNLSFDPNFDAMKVNFRKMTYFEMTFFTIQGLFISDEKLS